MPPAEDLEWAECMACGKWRKLPSGVAPPGEADEWYCHMNEDELHNTCAAEEEEDDAWADHFAAHRAQEADEEADERALRAAADRFAKGLHTDDVEWATEGAAEARGVDDEESDVEDDEDDDDVADEAAAEALDAMRGQIVLFEGDPASAAAGDGEEAAAAPDAAEAFRRFREAEEHFRRDHWRDDIAARLAAEQAADARARSWESHPEWVAPGHAGFNAFAQRRMRESGVPSNVSVATPAELEPVPWADGRGDQKPKLQPYQETVSFLCRPLAFANPRMLVVHRTGAGKTATIVQIANAYFDDRRPKARRQDTKRATPPRQSTH